MNRRLGFRHRLALRFGPRLMAFGFRLRGVPVDMSKVEAAAREFGKAGR